MRCALSFRLPAVCGVMPLVLVLTGAVAAQSPRSTQPAVQSPQAVDDPKGRLAELGRNLKEAAERGEVSRDAAKETHKLMSFYLPLDTNRNGKLEPEEYVDSRYRSTIERRIRDAGFDPGRPVELNAFMSRRLGPQAGDSRTLRVLVDQYAPKSMTSAMKHAANRQPVTLDLPDDLVPFDRDNDGQLGLYEWPRSELTDFEWLDRNKDGFITPREVRIADAIRQSMNEQVGAAADAKE